MEGLIFLGWVGFWLFSAACVGICAAMLGRRGWLWTLLALLAPLVLFLILAFMGKPAPQPE